MSGDERYQTVLEELNQKQFGKGEMKMCEIYDQILNKGIQQEKANTEKERKRAEAAQKRAETAEKEKKKHPAGCFFLEDNRIEEEKRKHAIEAIEKAFNSGNEKDTFKRGDNSLFSRSFRVQLGKSF